MLQRFRNLSLPSFLNRLQRNNSIFPKIPRPEPLGDKKEQIEYEESLKRANQDESIDDGSSSGQKYISFKGDTNPDTGEIGGPRGLEPTRYGDWEGNGRCTDF
ncbi:hypothetical protein O9G_005407 [Rozella allomycis CSF55]|uniref:Succinate dehydrogenase assembly factor 4, mitochondrial n=1 Tax=Rozella allomycis (strain CSF55) TaxID=988480 RepID=A0A075B071_ROZAC|nr:hypothetical protein O9G_005407 [Rozella allomycis CSF55]|eukprot:EPZ35770.1 hypothetical protein O9G_005407 [Rozella allomycis CSF55]